MSAMRKRARAGSGGGVAAGKTPAWNELKGFFHSMDRAKLLILLGEAWDSDDMRQTLTNGLIGTWASADDQKALLNYDWALAPGEKAYNNTPKTIKLKSTKSGKKKVELPEGWALEMETIRDMETLDGDAFEYGDDDMGCEECGAPDSYIRLELQKNRAQDLRLRVYTTCFCWCNTMYGEPYSEDAEHFYVPMQNAAAKKVKS